MTVDVTPHHLSLTDAALVGYNTNRKTVPPLRTEDDRLALIKGLKKGHIACIATAHAPHTVKEKDQAFDDAPFGVLGLETALPICLESLVRSGVMTLAEMVACLTIRAAKVLELPYGTLTPGASADFTLFDPEECWQVTAEALESRSHNSPWLNQELRGRVWRTYCQGRLAWDRDVAAAERTARAARRTQQEGVQATKRPAAVALHDPSAE